MKNINFTCRAKFCKWSLLSAVVFLAQCGHRNSTNDPDVISSNDSSPFAHEISEVSEGAELISAAKYDYLGATIDKCESSLGSPGENCFFFLAKQYEPRRSLSPKSRLVIFFSGGEMGCGPENTPTNLSKGYGELARLYADAGFVFACAQLFEMSVSSSAYPFSKESMRVDLLVKEITSRAKLNSWWNGSELLISGVSHGASSPVFAMRHTDVEKSSEWKGTTKTAACFFDGISDINSLASWQRSQKRNECKEQRDRMYCGRYGLSESCQASSTLDIQRDSLHSGKFAATAANFDIKQWKLVSCGSQKTFPTPCGFFNDAIPDEQQTLLCDVLNQGRGKPRCAYQTFPSVAHMSCTDVKTDSSCLNWFANLKKTDF